MSEITIKEVVEWKLPELYAYVKLFEDDYEQDLEEEIKSIEAIGRTGIPIQYYIQNYYKEYPEAKITIVLGFGEYDIETIWKDIEFREKKMRKFIKNHLMDEGLDIARVES